MGIPDKHDPRTFTHLAVIGADGSVVAVRELADGTVEGLIEQSDTLLVDVTDLYPYDLNTARIANRTLPTRPPPSDLAAMRTYRADCATVRAAAKATLVTANRGRR